MVGIHYNCYHIPEKCCCPYHKQIYTCNKDYREFSTYKEALEEIAKWSCRDWCCWVYEVLSVVETD